jgi:hypothetical protein
MRVISARSDGHSFEREVLGLAFDDVNPRMRNFRTHNFKEAIALVRGFQSDLGWNPVRPKTDLSRSIFRTVASGLPTNEAFPLGLFNAIGTELDLRWGVDCWFEFGDRLVTVDLTAGRFKRHFKADYVLSRYHFLTNKHFGVARSIARRLQTN